jgi:(p)ppGpp synthase/HD superfamily hydrolase
MTDVEFAKTLAEKAHMGQVDKGGHPYIEHPMAVAGMVDTDEEKIVAYLHDVVEDTGIPMEVIDILFGDEISDAVECMTHRKGEDYFEYILRVSKNPVSTEVKLADLKHNMDLSRIANPQQKDYDRLSKYEIAKGILEYIKSSKKAG